MKHYLFIFAAVTAVLFSGCSSHGQQKSKAIHPKQEDGGLYIPATGQIIQHIKEKRYEDLKPGDIAPDAVEIDVSFIGDIVNGTFKVVRGIEGTQMSLMDINGKLLVPYGKYDIKDVSTPYVAMFKAVEKSSDRAGYLNSNGQPGIPFAFLSYKPFDFSIYKTVGVSFPDPKNKYIEGSATYDAAGHFYLTDYTKHKRGFVVTGDGRSEGTIPYYETKYQNFILQTDTFFNKRGQQTIPHFYTNARPFSEGLAAVCKVNQFGEGLWGYMDTTGKMVIPYTYSIMPGDFHNNRALVIPKTKTTFDYAYINRTGKVVITMGDGHHDLRFSNTLGDFQNGYLAFGDLYKFKDDELIDTNNVHHKISEIIEDPKQVQDESGFAITGTNDMGYILRASKHGKSNVIGMMSPKGKILFPLVFSKLKPDFYSPYAYAEIYKESYPGGVIRGIVNSQGVFVCVIKKPTTF